MPHAQQYIRNHIEQTIKNGATNFAIKTAVRVFDGIITLAVGYEVGKITSDDVKDVWTYVEFVVVLSLCACMWIVKCCCLNKFCINCFINCIGKKRNRREDIRMENENNARNTPEIGIWEKILQTLHMILNRLAIGAIGYELKKQLTKQFQHKQFGTWDYIEITAITIFCLIIFTIKYCILKCYFLKCCCSCCFKKNRTETECIEIYLV